MGPVCHKQPCYLGWHSGCKFGKILVNMLENLEISSKIISITADNSSRRSTLASRFKHCLGGTFEANIHSLRCMAHVINIFAHNGIKDFG
ncbi:uncharacterized protein VP01_3873g1 [Puccinia sorghi]|uniref:HAT C-terminal dimerisation domain-containing protein n=1 Tax=Puccinia sorghi TaxID=27349 RepID=A0A0L6UUV6_9BASI|nr:uncharacterized protein VP01_3873g1 [Puccinia sorghi]